MYLFLCNIQSVCMQLKQTKAEQYEKTRAKLLAVARQEFATVGYTNAATNHIVEQAGVTRGALYYHFKDKTDLFRAVVEDIAQEIAERILSSAIQNSSAWQGLVVGCHTFIEACSQPDVRQILLLDAPSVLGWKEWRAIDERHGMGVLRAGLQACQQAGEMHQAPISALTHLLSAALNEAALAIAESNDPVTTHQEMAKAIDFLLKRLKKN